MTTTAARFGVVDGAALIVTTVVGAGIFTVPAYVASLAGGATLTLALWVMGGALALAGALSYAELAGRFPRGGAEYVYLREAFGGTVGFLSGWTSFVAGFSGAIAAAAAGFATYLAGSIPALSRVPVARLDLGPLAITLSGPTLVAVCLIALFTFISIAGVRASRAATNALALLVIVGVAIVIVACVAGGSVPTVGAPAVSSGSALSALVPIFFTYSGWNAVAYVAGECRDPRRTVPRALILGTLGVTVLYVALNAALLYALPSTALAASATPVTAAARMGFGPAGATLVSLLVLVALASSVCAMLITGPRIYSAMARDGVLPACFHAMRGRDGVPKASALAQSVWSIILVLTGTFGQLVSYTGFAIVIFSALAVISIFVLRRRLGPPVGYSVPWYPLVPAGFVLCCVGIAVSSFRYAPGPSLAGVALILAGLPVWWLMSRTQANVVPRAA